MIRRVVYVPLLLLLASSAAHAALHASVDNPQVATGDTVELTLTHDGQSHTEPDLAALKQDFDIVSRSTSTSLQIVNGSASSSTQFVLSLAPKHAGQLTIPAITWDSDRSTPITVTVGNGSSPGQSGAGAPASQVFLETTVDPKSPYVQGAVHVTVRVFTAVPLSHADLEFPTTDAAAVRQAASDQNGTTERNGQLYQVVARHYVLIPQHSGHLVIPGPVLSGEILVRRRSNTNDPFSGFFSNSPFGGMMATRKPVRVNGDSIVLDVRPRPTGAGSSYWLPARNVTLTAQWSPTQLQVHVGDPVTVNLHLQAEDATSAELPDLSSLLQLPAGMKAYPDEPKLKDSAQGDSILSQRDQSIALIADQPGRFTVPELRLSWWDTQSNQARESIIPARTIEVTAVPGSQASTQAAAAAPGESNTTQPSTAPASPNNTPTTHTTPPAADNGARSPVASTTPWPWVSLGLGLLWVGTVIAWLATRGKRRSSPSADARAGTPTPTVDASRARSAFQAACRENDALAARRNLITWANALSPGEKIGGLSALSKRVEDANSAGLMRELDRACYVGGPWDGAALAAALKELTLRERDAGKKKPALAPLYH